MTDAIDIPVTVAGAANAASASLANYGPKRTFGVSGFPGTATIKIWGSQDGTTFPPITATPLLTLGGEAAPKTIDDLSIKYRALPSVAGGVCSVDAQLDCCAAANFFNTLPLGNFPVGGVVTTSANVDKYGAFTIAQTTAGQTLTFPAPSDPSATYVRWVSNIGTVDFVLYGLLVIPNSATKIVWNGAAWVEGCTGTASPIRTVVSAAGVDILNSDGLTTGLGNTEAGIPGNSLQLFAGAGGAQFAVSGIGTLDIQTATGALSVDTSGGAINIGATIAAAKTILVGNFIGATGVGIRAGSAGIALGTATAGPISLGTDTTGAVTIDSGTTGAVNLATGPNAKTVTIGNLVGANNVILRSSVNMQLEVAAAGVLSLGTNATQHDVNIGSNVGTSSVAIAGGTGGVGVGSNAIAQTVTIGNIVGASAVNILAGSLGVSIQPAATGPLTAKSGTSGDATFDSGSTGAVHLGDGGNQKAVTVGSVTLAASLALRAGTGGLTIVNNGATWTWPTALGAAGTKLTDAAGNGVLSFA